MLGSLKNCYKRQEYCLHLEVEFCEKVFILNNFFVHCQAVKTKGTPVEQSKITLFWTFICFYYLVFFPILLAPFDQRGN